MYVEYCNYNKYIEDYNKEKDLIFKAISNGVDGICTSIYLLREMKTLLPKEIVLAIAIDYPLGNLSSKVKNHAVIEGIKSGANVIDYVPNYFLLQTNFIKFDKEMKELIAICKDYNTTPRVFLNYQYNKDAIVLAKYYYEIGIEILFPTIGYHHDDFNDNLLNCKILEEKGNIFSVFNGYIWRQDQFEQLKEANIFGVRLYDFKFGVYSL